MNTTQKIKTIDMVYIAIFAALIAICSWIAIPIGQIPITLQTFGVFAAVGLLGGRRGSIAVLIYILLGLIGVPVFAGFSGGPAILFGPTGGYIIGFLFSALTMWVMEKALKKSAFTLILSMIIGNIVCYVFGTAWFMVIYTSRTGPIGLAAALIMCVVPYIVPDLVKIALAFLLTDRLKRYVH